MSLLKEIARVFGAKELTESEAEAKLNATLSFEEQKEKATEEVAAAHAIALSAKDTEITNLKAENTRLTDENTKLQERVTELGNKAAAVHSTAATEVPVNEDKPWEKSEVNIKADRIRAAQKKQ